MDAVGHSLRAPDSAPETVPVMKRVVNLDESESVRPKSTDSTANYRAIIPVSSRSARACTIHTKSTSLRFVPDQLAPPSWSSLRAGQRAGRRVGHRSKAASTWLLDGVYKPGAGGASPCPYPRLPLNSRPRAPTMASLILNAQTEMHFRAPTG
ncbi:hypothetical protein AOQ84DRAFT_32032 [Glonium stellatum]|uniref:Uncharacterized protein n=1 Tax=Glonium stellatum TaxID=574774 RepID=A0A8E2F1T1_9PEZI|nr:hypothetical protein AOQ84DRAFT_32032 [Glonium stellatum]